MINSIGNTLSTTTGKVAASSSSSEPGGFSAALQAAQKADERKQHQMDEMEEIKTKGFTAWVRDTQIEALKEKLRQMVMDDMGVDENSLSQLTAAMREILEKKIQEEVDRRMQEAVAEGSPDTRHHAQTAATAATQTGKKDQDGKTCSVIPALSWPGAASLL